MITRQDIEEQCELIQDDLRAIFKDMSQPLLTCMCQFVIGRMAVLKNKIDDSERECDCLKTQVSGLQDRVGDLKRIILDNTV